MPALSPHQTAVIEHPLNAHTFLEGPAGTGKTTTGAGRVQGLIESGVAAEAVLILVPQRTLAAPYYAVLRRPDLPPGGQASVLTLGGLARRMVDLFWPVVAEAAGFAQPDQPPVFLTLETAQYYMAGLVQPFLAEGFFKSVTLDRNRLYSQILDNLSKAAAVGFPHTEIGERLTAAWAGDPGQERVYQDVQACAARFREHCLAHNLLDFSLQLEMFWRHLWPLPVCQDYLVGTYRHLVADNLEEDTPLAHDLLAEWLPHFDSALLIYDHDAGFRRFLAADPDSAYQLRVLCPEQVTFAESFTTPAYFTALSDSLSAALDRPGAPLLVEKTEASQQIPLGLIVEPRRFYPEMLDWVTGEVARLVHEAGVPPAEIVVLAPYLSDALRYSLMDRLGRAEVPVRSHRPSRSLRDEPATQCLLTLAALAHPAWGRHPDRFDLAYALVQAIADLDLVRAQLLAGIVHRARDGAVALSSFDLIKADVQKRITYRVGERYEALRQWLETYTQGPPAELDHFLARLFGEVLSQPGYGFHADYDAGRITATLIESVRKFRWVAEPGLASGRPLGQEYLEMVADGVIAAQYIGSWVAQPADAVLLAPAYTFLLSNQPVSYQFWLDTGSQGWFERLDQPLTQPFVLSRQWPPGRVWTDNDEFEQDRDTLYRLCLGLLRRCRRRIYLAVSDLGEQGYEQRGQLLHTFQRVFKRLGLYQPESDEL